jgi:hypothetical protein
MGATLIQGSGCCAGVVGNNRGYILVWLTKIIVAFGQSEFMDL